MSTQLFDTQADRYEQLVNWSRRLANEEPFYRRQFADHDVKRVLDAACGTGHHARMFHQWGLAVEGADASEAMIDRCRASGSAGDRLHFTTRPFTDPHPEPGSFDAVICVGNSLPLAGSVDAAGAAVANLVTAVRDGGLIVLHILNPGRIPEGPLMLQKTLSLPGGGTDPGGQGVLIKGVHRSGDVLYMEFIELSLADGQVRDRHHETTAMPALSAAFMVEAVETAGATSVRLFGDYQGSPYVHDESTDLILVASRRGDEF